MMTPLDNLYYAIGELAYAVARADGEIQPAELDRLRSIVKEQVKRHKSGYEIAEIIFQVMQKEAAAPADAYNRAMKDVRLNSHYLSPELKEIFVAIMEEVAAAFPPVTGSEKSLIEKFRSEIAGLNGDPVYYNS